MALIEGCYPLTHRNRIIAKLRTVHIPGCFPTAVDLPDIDNSQFDDFLKLDEKKISYPNI
jgi:hypothetical protein